MTPHTIPHSPDDVDPIQKASHADIIRWTDNLLDCTTIESVFAADLAYM